MARHPQQNLGIPQLPMALLAIYTIGLLLITSEGKRWAMTAICLHTPYMFMIPLKVKSTERVIQAYLSGILANTIRSVAILSDVGTEFKNKVLNEVCHQLGIKRLFSNPNPPQGNAKVENVNNFLKITLTKFLNRSELEQDELILFACYCYNIFPGSNTTKSLFFLMFG